MLNAIVFYLLFSFLGFLTSNLFIGKSGFDMDIKENSLMLQIRKIGFFYLSFFVCLIWLICIRLYCMLLIMDIYQCI